MMTRSMTRISRAALGHVGARYFSITALHGGVACDVQAHRGVLGGAANFFHGNPAKNSENMVVAWMRLPAVGARNASTVSLGEKQQEDEKKVQGGATSGASAGGENNNKGIVSYWGVEPAKITKEDGTEWRWNCFKPWETYKADLSIDLKKHHAPVTFLDKVAYWTVKSLRYPTDIFFQRRYGCRAMMLETVAAVPGMVGGLLLHCKSLRRFEHSGGWIKALLEEAENERMHLMTFMEVSQPKWYERALVFTVQGVFFNAYFLTYLVSPKLAHRIVGYLEEEAIHSYTEFLKELDKGTIENVPAPAIAIDYWRLPPDSTLRDVVIVVRADEAHHRDVNHFASDIHYQGHELKKAPAPIGYH
ncbi:Ubiquinol oxidase 1a [Forsythia ovata]|uniref:Ubiquinol oxidase n=1 Tax=Forsythia ovata TaxID=205694 RepID=A0ABD1W4F1_9LAMI